MSKLDSGLKYIFPELLKPKYNNFSKSRYSSKKIGQVFNITNNNKIVKQYIQII